MSRLDDMRARLEAERDADKAKREEQLASDLEAVLELLPNHGGPARVRMVEVKAWIPGIPALAVVRCPKPVEVKRFQARMGEENPNRITALEELAALCVIHPEKGEARDALYLACPGLPVQLAQEALQLSLGEAQAAGKG